jgi:hypothetical protein
VNIDMIVQNVSGDGRNDISFTMPTEDLFEESALLGGGQPTQGPP